MKQHKKVFAKIANTFLCFSKFSVKDNTLKLGAYCWRGVRDSEPERAQFTCDPRCRPGARNGKCHAFAGVLVSYTTKTISTKQMRDVLSGENQKTDSFNCLSFVIGVWAMPILTFDWSNAMLALCTLFFPPFVVKFNLIL